MSRPLNIRYSFRMEEHDIVGGSDADFYHSLPNVDEHYRNSRTGLQENPRPDLMQSITAIGTALLSSSVLATAITTYLASRRVKIKIVNEVTHQSIEYEGPNLPSSQSIVEAAINKLVETPEHKPANLQIIALKLPGN